MRRWLAAVLLLCLGQAALATSITELRTERSEDGVFLAATVRFDLPPVVEDALLKGIAMYFVVEADIYRDRWYWTDPKVASAARTIRLAYQPLTRRWRVNVTPGAVSNLSSGLRTTFNQNFDTLPEALAAVQRVGRWKIADAGVIDPDARHQLEFKFRLDLSQLPRPFQIGVAGQRDWTVAVEIRQRLQLETAPALAPVQVKEAEPEVPK